ncbi:HAMP domain-containing histidine kinase [Kaistella flava (ex Peng et al. 2021)]|uniref:histidine kinase n=1 Tax=Kaistella flava (ex Peng et al. 2021) TaxID=2038776 RepID=A0A7M2Y660_9FLAO|nr:HAMP domain-containing sensor histidine kinase [Kaistella flava (ex Peng et al. 2021)]QOW09576.1 HAMP domain-containing histidine kinase [Kaistella flava (ex Peng et al. 2021)]
MKLTHYISIRYIGISCLVLLISIPVFYVVIQKVLTNNIDENLKDQKKWTTKQLKSADLGSFHIFDERIKIEENPEKLNHNKVFTEDIFNKKDDETESFRVIEFPVTTSTKTYNVRIQQSLVESEDLLKSILYLLFGILGLLIISLFIINIIVKRNIWSPFYHTLDELKNFRIDEANSLNLKGTKIRELNDLNTALNTLTEKNKKLYQSQKEFTENASHELQTPLAIIQNNVELVWQTEPISEEQAEFLENISEANTRMSRLNKSLLLLSKIDNQQFNDIEVVNFNVLSEKFLKSNTDQIQFKNINIKTDFTQEMKVKMDQNLAEILINNILSNAIKYCPNNGDIFINAHENSFEIINNAENESLNMDKLFQRFQKQSSKENSTGLGLEISKKICENFGLELSYHFKDQKHHFTILNKNSL